MHTYKMLLALIIDRVEKKRYMASLSQELLMGWDPKSQLLNIFNNGYLFCCTVRCQTIHINAVRLCKSWQDVLLTGEMVDWQGSLARSQILIVVDSKFSGELSFDGGSPLELVVDLHTETPSRFFELCGDIGRPLRSMGSEFPYLQQKWEEKKKSITWLSTLKTT